MSLTFAQRGNRPPPNPAQIQKMLDENGHLIQTIQEYQSKGKAQESMQYQSILHRNLVYLASIADSNQNIHTLLPVSLSPLFFFMTLFFVYNYCIIVLYNKAIKLSIFCMIKMMYPS